MLGALALQGNNTLDSIRLQNSAGTQTTGISITGTSAAHVSNIVLNDITVGAASATTGYATGMDLSYADNVSLKNSSVYAYRQNSASDTKGINSSNSKLTLDKSNVTATYSGTTSTVDQENKIYGIYVSGGELTVSNGSNITATADSTATATKSGSSYKGLNAYGIYGTEADAPSKITLDNSSVTATTTTSKNTPITSYGIHVDGKSELTLQGTNPTITATATASGNDNLSAVAYGIDAEGKPDDTTHKTITMKSGTVKATANSAGASTLESYRIKMDGSTATISGGTVEASSTSNQASAFGIYLESSSNISISNTTITANANGSARGIYANASTVTASNNKFNITSEGKYGLDGLGYIIQMIGGTLTQSGNTFNRNSAMGQDVKQ